MHSVAFPRVTVLIDTYNYARFIERAIESALRQEYSGPEPEILVVDDGSTDETAVIARRFAPRVRFLAKQNGGQASALNLGFREATGDIVCLLDGDDYFYPGKVQAVADVFRRWPEVGLVYNEFDIVDGTGASLGKVYPEPTWTGYRLSLSSVPAQLRSLILFGHPWTAITSAMSIRRSVLADLEVPEDEFPHSPDLFLGLALPFMTEVAVLSTAATAYVYHGDNVGLYRSSAANRALHGRQMDFIRRFAEKRFGVHFLRYSGHSVYASGSDGKTGRNGLAEFFREWNQVAATDVDPAIRRRCQAQLAAGLLLPDVLYDMLRRLRAQRRTRRSRRHYRLSGFPEGYPAPVKR